jgi:hypothetical protein
MSFLWNDKLLDTLNRSARSHQFDWPAVASDINRNHDGITSLVTADDCRQVFATCNVVGIPENYASQTEVRAPVISVVINDRTEALVNMSLEELQQHVEELEENVRLKKEAVFQRVLDSLGGPLPANQAMLSAEAVQILNDSRAKREQLKREQQKKIEDERERQRFEQERERLRKRFDPDSVDALGDNPISASTISGDPFTAPLAFVALDSILQSEEFDIILSELEKELDAQAMGKDDGEHLSM